MEKKICSICGSKYEDISETQLIGCSECYYAFEKEFKNALRKYGITEPYSGSFPKKLKGYKSTLTSRVEMQFKLEEAVQREEYEKAAFYRDYLKVLNKESLKSDPESGENGTVSFDTNLDSELKLPEKAEKEPEDE